MTPQQSRLLAQSYAKLENRLYELGSAIFERLFEIDPSSRPLFKGNMDEQKLKLARLFGEFIRVRARSQHFLPVTGKAGQVVIPGIGSLGARHEMVYGVRPEQYAHMREAVLYAIRRLLGHEYNEEIGQAWSEIFDMLAHAMQEHAGGNPAGSAFAKLSLKGGPRTAALMEWSDKFSVGIGQIDNEHKRLLVLLNELNNVVEGSAGLGVLGGVLDGLVDYTHYHFAHEEDLFQRSSYPAYEQHRQQHVDFVAKVTAVYGDFKSGSSAVQPALVLEFLKSWLYQHILGSDRAFGAYLLANPSSLRPEIRRR